MTEQPAIDALGMNKNHRALLKHLDKIRKSQRRRVRKALDSEHWTHFKLNCMLFDFAVDVQRRRAGLGGGVDREYLHATASSG